MTHVLTLKEMVKFNNETAGNMVRFAVHRDMTDGIPLTQDNLQDMYENRVSVHTLAKPFNLSFEVRRKPTENGHQGSIVKYVDGENLYWIRTRMGVDRKEELFSIEGQPLGYHVSISFHYGDNAYYPAPHCRGKGPFCMDKEVDLVKGMAEKYNLRLLGVFRTNSSFCKTCGKELG